MNFNYIAKKLGGKNYTIIFKNPNAVEDIKQTVFGIVLLTQKTILNKFGESEGFDGEFYCNKELQTTDTILLIANNKQYQLLIKYDLQNESPLASFKNLSHVCYQLREYGSAD